MQLPGSLCPTPVDWGLCLLQTFTLPSNRKRNAFLHLPSLLLMWQSRVQLTTSLTTPILLPSTYGGGPQLLCLLLLH